MKKKGKGMKSSQQGVSLLELSLVVGISALILLLIYYFYVQTQADAMISKAVITAQRIDNAAYQWLQAQKQMDFCGTSTANPPANVTDCTTSPVSMTALANAGLISNSDLSAPWGSTIAIEPALTNSAITPPPPSYSPSGAAHVRVWLNSVPSVVMCNQLNEDLAANSPTGVEHGCIGQNFFIEF